MGVAQEFGVSRGLEEALASEACSNWNFVFALHMLRHGGLVGGWQGQVALRLLRIRSEVNTGGQGDPSFWFSQNIPFFKVLLPGAA